MKHHKFDLKKWIREFPLERLRNEAKDFVLKRAKALPSEYQNQKEIESHIKLMSPSGSIVVGPEHIAVNLQLRKEAYEKIRFSGVRFPTDVFIWAKGEPQLPFITKIGGIPFLPSEVRWPLNGKGLQIPFLAQISFIDSKDLFENKLPGDVLLVFGETESLYETEKLILIWVNVTENLKLHPLTPIEHQESLSPFYGEILRTEDWPDIYSFIENDYHGPEDIAIFQGTKIGGLPSWIQKEETQSGVFLASLGSISTHHESRWSFTNVEEPRGWDHGDNYFQIGDMGSLYFFLNSNGTVTVLSQCY